MDNLINPFLDDTDDEELLYAALDSIKLSEIEETPKQEVDKTTPWYREYTDEELAAIKEMIDAGITPPGRKPKTTVYGRRDVTENDTQLMALLFKYKYLTVPQIAFAMNRAVTTINRRLKGLQELGLVDSFRSDLTRMIWFVKKAAIKAMEACGHPIPEDYVLIRTDKLGTGELAHTLAVNQAAINFNSPQSMIKGFKNVPDARLITETRIKKMFGRAQAQGGFTSSKSECGENAKSKVRIDLREGTLEPKNILNKYPELWTLTSPKVTGMKASEWSTPDLVINNERKRVSATAPVSFAIEIELTKKTGSGDYERIMETYKADKLVYAAVVWVVKDKSIEAAIRKACVKIGFPEGRVFFTDLVAANGQPYTKARDF